MSELQYMRSVRWAVMRDSLVRLGAYEVNRVLYKSCTSSDLVGHVLAENMAGIAGMAEKSGKSGRKRAKAGEKFFLALLVVRLLHQLFRV